MSCRVPKILFSFFTVLLSVSFASASDGHGEAPKEAAPKEIKSAEDSYSVVQARVAALEAKIRSSEVEIQKLILEKQHSKDPVKVNEAIQHMMTLHKEMKQNLKEYDQQRTLLKYRYPEKGQVEKREYERIEVKSLEEMETQMSLGSSVKRTLKKVRTQYEAPEDGPGRASLQNADGQKNAPPQGPSSLVEPVILKK